MEAGTIVRWLEGIPFFEDFKKEELESLASDQGHFYKYSEKDRIIQEGERDTALYILLKGSVRVSKQLPDKEMTLSVLNEGAIFGEMTLLRKGKRTSSVTAEKTCVIMVLKPYTLQNLDGRLLAKIKDQLLKIVLRRFERLEGKYTDLVNQNTMDEEVNDEWNLKKP